MVVLLKMLAIPCRKEELLPDEGLDETDALLFVVVGVTVPPGANARAATGDKNDESRKFDLRTFKVPIVGEANSDPSEISKDMSDMFETTC